MLSHHWPWASLVPQTPFQPPAPDEADVFLVEKPHVWVRLSLSSTYSLLSYQIKAIVFFPARCCISLPQESLITRSFISLHFWGVSSDPLLAPTFNDDALFCHHFSSRLQYFYIRKAYLWRVSQKITGGEVEVLLFDSPSHWWVFSFVWIYSSASPRKAWL